MICSDMIGLPNWFYSVNSLKTITVVRRLLNYESPYLAVKLSGQSASLVMRKRYLIEFLDI